MRILVTGGAGYIGSVLVPELLVRGYDVTVLDRFPKGDASLAPCCRFPSFTPIKGDVRFDVTSSLLSKHHVVLPLAALVGAPACARDPVHARSTNLDAIRSMLQLMSKDQTLIFPTTNSGYGLGQGQEFCTEDSPLKPISIYGQTKVDAEKAVLDSGKGVTLRLATVFGMSPRMRLDLLVNDFVYRAVKDRAIVIFEGHFRRNFIHVLDVTHAFLHALENFPEMRGQAYNVGLSDANLSKIELCTRIQEYVPEFTFFEAPVGEDPDKRDYIVSNDKIEATGFRCGWSLNDGIKEMIKGFSMMDARRFVNT